MSENETPIKTPKELIYAIAGAFIIPVIVIVLLTKFVGSLKNPEKSSDAYTAEKIAQRIQPIGTLRTEPYVSVESDNVVLASVDVGPLSGEAVYSNRCAACHEAGVLNAPKIGDIGAWKPRLGQGLDKLVYSVLNGKGSMGAQKGPLNTDEEIKAAVVYLTNKSGGLF